MPEWDHFAVADPAGLAVGEDQAVPSEEGLVDHADRAGGQGSGLLGGVGLPTPDLEAWLTKNRPAIGSPRLAQTVRADG